MNVKTDTKEKFSVITPEESEISANMSEKLTVMLENHLKMQPPHVILNLTKVENLSTEAAQKIAETAGKFMESNCSFVVCCIQKKPFALLEEMELADILNITPTESEAWDIVQMEEIERELLSGDFPDNES